MFLCSICLFLNMFISFLFYHVISICLIYLDFHSVIPSVCHRLYWDIVCSIFLSVSFSCSTFFQIQMICNVSNLLRYSASFSNLAWISLWKEFYFFGKFLFWSAQSIVLVTKPVPDVLNLLVRTFATSVVPDLSSSPPALQSQTTPNHRAVSIHSSCRCKGKSPFKWKQLPGEFTLVLWIPLKSLFQNIVCFWRRTNWTHKAMFIFCLLECCL